MTPANATRRTVMLTAWDAKRAEPARSFADCLRGAWACVKRLNAYAAKMAAKVATVGHLRLSPSLIRSPIRNSLRGQRYAGRRDFQAAYTTAVVGA